MSRRILYILLTAGLAAVAALATLSNSASATPRTITVQLGNGQVITITVDVPPGTPLDQIQLPGEVVPPGTPSQPPPAAPQAPSQGSQGSQTPKTDKGSKQKQSGSKDKAEQEEGDQLLAPGETEAEPQKKDKKTTPATPMRNPDGSPSSGNPGGFDALPGPTYRHGVPNFVIRKFRVPVFLLPIYQAAGIQYGIRWEILAAINEIETDYGRNLNVSSAGAMGWMQFIPSSWKAYGVDANKDGRKDPYNPVDAIFAAARYLKAAGYEKDVRRSIFAYNHADWYVDSVMLRAKLIAGVPGDLVGSLTGLTEGRFPVYAKARYADDLSEQEAQKRVKRNQNAANVVESDDSRRGIEIYAKKGSPAVAVNDGEIKKIGRSKELGRYIVLQDVYGNQYTYSGLDEVASTYPVPRDELDERSSAKAVSANAPKDPEPEEAASAGTQQAAKFVAAQTSRKPKAKPAAASAPRPSVAVKERLFAHPGRPASKEAGGADQLLASKGKGFSTFKNYFSRPLGLDPKEFRLKRLRKGSRVIGGTILGRVGTPEAGKGSHLYFEIRPAGKGAPKIDPKPILDGWKLLEATAIYRASGKNALRGDDDAFSIGQILLLPKPLLEKRVLSDSRIEIYDCGRQDIRSGQIDRRVLAGLAYLSESGLRPAVSSLKCGHSYLTSAGGVSHHSSGNAVDIWKINGIPILGHQEKGGITEQTVRHLLKLQGTMAPDQLISLLNLGGPSFAMGDHADHIHLGFRPRFGANPKAGKQALAVLKPGQWDDLLNRLRKIDNPVVPTKPGKGSIPVKKSEKRSSEAHAGE